MWRTRVPAIVATLTALLISACATGDLDADLLNAAENGQLAQVESLLAKGADFETKDDFDRTPLMLSAFGGHEKIVALLLKEGADVTAKAKYGQTALQFAEQKGDDTIAAMLKVAGTDM